MTKKGSLFCLQKWINRLNSSESKALVTEKQFHVNELPNINIETTYHQRGNYLIVFFKGKSKDLKSQQFQFGNI